jgi:hypothetical protein
VTKKTAKRKALPKQGRPPKSVDQAEVAAILAFAALHTDEAAAKQYRVSVRTIQRWKLAVKEGNRPEVAELVAQNKRTALEAHSDLLDETFEVALKALQDKLKDPAAGNTLRQVAGALKIAGELKLQRDFLRDDDDSAGVHSSSAVAEDAEGSASGGTPGKARETGTGSARTGVH